MSDKQTGRVISSDIVVIGAGGAGLAAAVSAAEAGAKNIIVLEKTDKPGGNSLNIGCFFAVNSPLQKRMGIHVSEEMAFHDKMAHCHWRVNARLIRDTIRISGDIVQWLENKGVIFECMMNPGFGSDAPRVAHDASAAGEFGFTGRTIINALSNECRKYGIKILCNTRARNITAGTDGKSFRISAENEKGIIDISSKVIVLSTGGFGGNPGMIEKYFPGYGKLTVGSVPQVTGDGLVMAEGLGAITDDRICLLLLGPFSSVNLGMVTPGVIYVNKEGERYYDESAQLHNYNPDDVANTGIRQRDKTSYVVFDAKLKESMVQGAPKSGMMRIDKDKMEKDFQQAATEGKAIVSDSWDEIAAFIGAKPEMLKATIERYNSFCEYGYDSDFFKIPQYLIALRTPPYYAIKCQPSINTTFGGIKINHRTEVLNKQEIPIAGLYAVGDNAGSWAPATYSHRYPGSAASFALCSGYIAGENSAKYVLSKK